VLHDHKLSRGKLQLMLSNSQGARFLLRELVLPAS